VKEPKVEESCVGVPLMSVNANLLRMSKNLPAFTNYCKTVHYFSKVERDFNWLRMILNF
jgi:hypothetical protein